MRSIYTGADPGFFFGGARVVNNKGWYGQSVCAHVSVHQGGSGGPPPDFFRNKLALTFILAQCG